MNIKVMWWFVFIPLSTSATQQHWTLLLKKNFSEQECLDHKNKKQLLFTRTKDLFPFTQLVPSWCALKPLQGEGYFEFYVQVRDAKTQEWYDWHHMIDWGDKIQKSFSNTGPLGTRYCHVRLELPEKHYADAFRIKVIACENADLSLIKSLAVNIADLRKFKEEQPKDIIKNLASCCILSVPEQSQMVLNHPKADCMCSPTSCFMLTSYINQLLGNTVIDPLNFADSVYDCGLQAYGSWPFNTVQCFQLCKEVFFRVARLNSFVDIYNKLKENIPVVVSVRGKVQGAPKEYNNGHLLLVIGWNKEMQKIICHDPAFSCNENVYVEYDFDAFCAAWGRSYHLAYLAEPLRTM